MNLPPTEAEIAPAPYLSDLLRFPLDGGLVLHRRSQARYWLLNATGALAFQWLENGEPVRTVAQRLAETQAVPLEDAAGMLDQTLRAWTESGLFLPPETPREKPDAPPLPDPHVVRFERYVFSGKRVALGLDDPTLARALRGLLFPWRVDADRAPDDNLDARLLVNRTPTGLALFHDGVLVEQDSSLEVMETALLRTLHGIVHRLGGLGAIFHAGSVVRNGGALLLPGVTHAGKSTLTLALALDGYGLLGDDFAFLDLTSGNVVAPPTAAKLRSPEPLQRSSRAFDLSRLLHAPEDDFVHLADAVVADADRATGFPPRMLCFPVRQAGRDGERRPRLVRLSTLESVARLIESSSWFNPEPDAMRRTLDLIAAIPAYALEYDRIDEALDLLLEADFCG